MVVVPDVADMFMPLLTGFFVPRADAVNSISILMNQIPAMFAETKDTEAVLASAIQAGMEALKVRMAIYTSEKKLGCTSYVLYLGG